MLNKNKQLRILILTHAYSNVISGGETKAAWEFTNALAKRGIKIYVVTTFVKIETDVPHANIKIYRIPFCQQTRNFDKLGMFKTFLYSLPIIFLKKIDIIHLINTQSPHPFSKVKIRPFVSTVDLQWNYDDLKFKDDLLYDRKLKLEEYGLKNKDYNLFDKILGKIASWFFKALKLNELLPKTVDLCAYRHKKILNQLKEQGYKCQTVYIPVGVDTEKFNQEVEPIFEKNNQNLIFLFVGSIAKRKGVEYLIQAFNELNKKYKNIELILIGPGAPQFVERVKNMIDIGAKITLVGELTNEELIRYYSYADVFVAPSVGIDLGFNKSVVEAMACEKPVIITKAHDSEMFNGQIGFCVEAGNMQELSQAMEKFINNPTLIKTLGKQAREFILKNHDWRVLAERMECAYRKLLEK